MNHGISDTVALHGKKAVLWTPWGSQRVPDLDKAIENPGKTAAKARPRVRGFLARKPVTPKR